MSAAVWKIYDSFGDRMGDAVLDMGGDTFKCAFFTSSHIPASTDDSYSALTNEVVDGNGYSTGGITLTGVTWVESDGSVTFDCDDIEVTPSGGGFVFRYAIIYNDTDTAKQLVAMCLIDDTPGDITVTSYPLVLKIATTGVLVLSRSAW